MWHIPETVADVILNTLSWIYSKKVNVLVDPYNIEDCHCLKSGKVESTKVIIKLSRWKDDNEILKAKPGLKDAGLTDTGTPSDTPVYS